jgi:hypothetical protein
MTAKRCLVLSAVFLLTSLFAASAFAGADIVVVRDWDGIEISNGGWYPFGAGGPNVPDTRRFRIYNSGTSNLIINNPTTFLSGNGFSIIATPVGTIHAGESTTFRVQFLASTPGDYYGAITFNTNDPDEDPYVIHLWGAVNAAPAPEIAVFRNWDDVPVPDGGSFTFPDEVAGISDSRRFRITNTGTAPLILGNPATLVSGPCFHQIETPVTPIAAGASGWFRVRILCNTPGTYTGTVSIQSNDADEGSYDFTVSGRVMPPPGPDIAVFRNWDNVAVPDGGSFTFPDPVVAGVSDSRRFRITNTGNAPLNLTNPTTLVTGPCFHLIETPATPIAAGASGWFRVRILCNTPGTYTGTVSIQSDDADENPYDFTVSGTVTPAGPDVPEIGLYYDNTAVADGGSYVFPNSVPTGQAATRTFRIENSGTATLTIANPNSLVSGTCFSQTGPPPASSIAPGANTTFTVQVQCSTAGTKTGAITIQNNDGNENPYDVALQALVGTVDFSVSVTPGSMRIRRGTSITATVRVTGASGFNSDVSLSAANLPSGTNVSFQPASIRPGQSSTMMIHAGNSGPFGDYSIQVRGTAGGVTHDATASLRVTNPNALPTISAIQPETIPAGHTSTVTLTGTNFTASTVTIGGGTDRAFPTLTVASVSADGTRMEVQVNATDPAVLHHYALYVKNFHGEDGINFRVVPPGPVIDYWSPSEAAGGIYAMDVVGANLQGASVVSPGGGVSVFDVDNSEDETLSAFLKVESGSSGPVDLTIRGRDGVDATIHIDIRQQRSDIQQKTSAMKNSKGEPLFYIQDLKAREDLVPPTLAHLPATVNGGFDFQICAGWGRTRSHGRVWTRTWFKNPLTGEWGPFGDEVLANLHIGEIRLLETSTFTRWFFLEFSLNFRVCYSDDSGFDWDVEACISVSTGFHIPIVGGVAIEFEACLGSPSRYEIDLTGTGFLSFINFHREGSTGGGAPEPLQCTRFTDLDPASGSGERTFQVEQIGCCAESIGAGWSGDFYLGTMQVTNQHVGTTQPAPAGSPACLTLEFSTTEPNAPFRTVDPYSIPDPRIGILAGDGLHFRAQPQLNANQYSWGGAASGNGQEKFIQLNTPGIYEVTLTAQGTTRTARIVVYPVPQPPNQVEYFNQHPANALAALAFKVEADHWSESTFGPDQGNGRTDAGRHSYWVCIMAKAPLIGHDGALEISNAHEREGYENGDFHNTHVMDLGNNAKALAFSDQLQNRDQCAQRVIQAVNSGELTIIEPGSNPGGTGLLVPSNRASAAAFDLCTAPTIDVQPVSQTITAGQPTQLSVSTTGGGGLSYQWYEGASGNTTTPVPGGTNRTLTVTPSATTSYWVRISATCGTTDSNAATVTVCNPLQILSPPADEVVVIGNTATLTVTAAGSGPLSYQWYEGTTGTTTNPVGTDAPTFTTPPIYDGRSYWVRVTDTCNGPRSVDSPAATVTAVTQITRRQIAANTVNSLTSITANWTRPTQPGSLLVAVMSSAHTAAVGAFTVPAGWQQAVGYEWNHLKTTIYYYPNNPGGRTSETITTAGFRDSVLQLIEYVGATATPLDVTAFDGDHQPRSGLISTGTTQWMTQPKAVLVSAFSTLSLANISNPTNSFVEIDERPAYQDLTASVHERMVDAVANYGHSASIDTAAEWLGLIATFKSIDDCTTAPVITAHPVSALINAAQSATLSVTATGDGLGYQWYQGASGTVNNPVAGANSSTLIATPAATASYWARVFSACGNADSNAATVTVCSAPGIATHPLSQSVTSGFAATLSVTPSGSGPFSYQWYEGATGTTTTPISGATSATYTTPALTANKSYWVRVTSTCNGAASVNSNTANITVSTASSIARRQLAANSANSQTSITTNWTQPTQAGSLLVAVLSAQHNASVGNFTPPAGWQLATSYEMANVKSAIYYYPNHPGGRTSETFGVAGFRELVLQLIEYTGATTAPLDKVVFNGDMVVNGGIVSTGTTAATSQAKEAVVTALTIMAPATFTAPTNGFAKLDEHSVLNLITAGVHERIVSTAGAYGHDANVNANTQWVGLVATFKSLDLCSAAPSITTQPASSNVNSGGTATLTVTATTSGGTLSYQWYEGASGVTTTPVGTNSASFTTPALTATKSYWVRVSNECGNVASNAATVTVCIPPAIGTHPASTTINSGQTATLTVTATGSGPLTYQWYEGASGVTTTPAGTNSASFTTPALTATKTYWVRVTSTCNGSVSVNSNAATVTVCTPPGIATQPASPAINSGQTATLSVVASGSGPFTYQWYEGASGTTTTPVGTNSASFTTPALTVTKSYWVRVTSSCNGTQSVNSNTATVTVCNATGITTHPASQTINGGQTATLSVVAAGSAPFTYQWYEGASGTTTTPVGTNSASFTTPALTVGKTYWVKVTGGCGSANSNAATITVCTAPGIATQPASQTISNGATATLNVVASGSGPFSYQWFEGASGTTTTPVGTNSASYTTPALTATKSYWVRVTSSCNGTATANSNTATITVNAPVLARRQLAANGVLSQLTITTNWTQPTQAGTLLVAVVSAERMTYPIANWQPPAGWQLAVSYEMARVKTSIYYYPNNPGGRTAETFGSGGYYDEMVLQLAEYTGVVTASPLDKTAFNGDNSNTGTIDTGYTAQTSQAKELVITGLTSYSATNFSGPSGGFVELDDRSPEYSPLTTAIHEKIVTTAGSWGHSAQVADPSQWVGVVATFKGQ